MVAGPSVGIHCAQGFAFGVLHCGVAAPGTCAEGNLYWAFHGYHSLEPGPAVFVGVPLAVECCHCFGGIGCHTAHRTVVGYGNANRSRQLLPLHQLLGRQQVAVHQVNLDVLEGRCRLYHSQHHQEQHEKLFHLFCLHR